MNFLMQPSTLLFLATFKARTHPVVAPIIAPIIKPKIVTEIAKCPDLSGYMTGLFSQDAPVLANPDNLYHPG